MKALYIASWFLFVTGFLFKFLHYPGHALLVLISCFLFFLHAIIYAFKKSSKDVNSVLFYFSVTAVIIYIFFRVQFWSYSYYPLFYAIILPFVSAVFHLASGSRITIRVIKLIFLMSFTIVLFFTPSYRIYEFTYLNKYLYKEGRLSNYRTWDKYSWFLYKSTDGKYQEAIDANHMAAKAVEYNRDRPNFNDAMKYLEVIKQHERLMLNGEWSEWTTIE